MVLDSSDTSRLTADVAAAAAAAAASPPDATPHHTQSQQDKGSCPPLADHTITDKCLNTGQIDAPVSVSASLDAEPDAAGIASGSTGSGPQAASMYTTEVWISCHGLRGLLFLDPDSAADLEAARREAAASGGCFAPTRGASKLQW